MSTHRLSADEVRAAREKLGLTQLEMSIRLGIRERTYWAWERQRGATPTGSILIAQMLEEADACQS